MDEFFGADVREPLEFHVGQLLGEDRGRWAQLGDVHLKNTVDSSIRLEVSKKSRHHLSTVVLRGMKGRGAGVAPDSPDGIHEDKNGRKRAEATHAPLSFPIFLLPGQIQPSSYLRLGRGFQVVSGRPTSRRSALNHPISSPLLLLDKDPSQR